MAFPLPRTSLLVLLGVIEIIILSLIGLFFYQWDKKEERQKAVQPAALAECRRTGCSSELCADHESASTCEFRPEYACYRTAECRRLPSGQCGFVETENLRQCLENAQQRPSPDLPTEQLAPW